MPLQDEVFELLVIRCNHYLLPPGQQDHPWLLTSLQFSNIHIFELDSKHFVEENQRIGALFPTQDNTPGYKYLGAMHWWRTNGVPLFDTQHGYPVDTTYKADSYFRSFRDEANRKTSQAAANDIPQLCRKMLRAEARINGHNRLEHLAIAKQNYLERFETEYVPISQERMLARRALHPVNVFTEAWRLTHGGACDCDACLDLFNQLPQAERQKIIEQGYALEKENRDARLAYLAELQYDPLAITQLRYKTFIEALDLGLTDIKLILVRKSLNPWQLRTRGILSDMYMLNRPERGEMMRQRALCQRCFQTDCMGGVEKFNHSSFAICPYCEQEKRLGWNCLNQGCISQLDDFEIHAPYEPQ